MLNSLTSFFFGSSAPEEQMDGAATPTTQTETDPTASTSTGTPTCRLKESQTEGEWVLIDKLSREASVERNSPSSSRSSFVRPLDCVQQRSPHTNHSPPSSRLTTTPPGAGGNSPQHMEQSPLENLLIEHPSMSVYGPRLRQGSTGMDSDISESSTEADVQVHPANRPSTSGTSRRMVTVRSSPRKPRAVAARAGLATNIQTVKLSQAAEKRNNKRRLSSGQLSRSNMTRRVESRGKRQRQASFLLQPSARSSNKRC